MTLSSPEDRLVFSDVEQLTQMLPQYCTFNYAAKHNKIQTA